MPSALSVRRLLRGQLCAMEIQASAHGRRAAPEMRASLKRWTAAASIGDRGLNLGGVDPLNSFDTIRSRCGERVHRGLKRRDVVAFGFWRLSARSNKGRPATWLEHREGHNARLPSVKPCRPVSKTVGVVHLAATRYSFAVAQARWLGCLYCFALRRQNPTRRRQFSGLLWTRSPASRHV